MGQQKPGDNFLGWLGRQIGYVKTAVKHDPAKGRNTPKAAAKPQAPKPKEAANPQAARPQAARPQAANPQSPKPQTPSAELPQVVYRADQVEELPHPTNPELKLRRTVIDEVIVDKKKES